jgi:predicted RNA polymerase sigma factor
VLYLIFNEGYTASSGCSAARIWPVRAIRLTRRAHAARPDHSEITGLLALMLLT